MSNTFDNKKEDVLNSFIDDLNDEKKPEAYKYLEDDNDNELEMLFETVRAVKRLRDNDNKSIGRKRGSKMPNNKMLFIVKTVAVASILLMVFLAGNIFNVIDFDNNQIEGNIVYAMEKAYEQLKSYTGVIEIKSESNGNIDYVERIEVKYKKPDKYVAVHSYDGYTYKQISDGEKLYTIDNNLVTIDYRNPQKNLWRYHIYNQIQELKEAREIEEAGSEILAGREALIYKFRFDENEKFHRIWIDKETNLPLKKELNLNDNRKLINHFIEIEVNSEIEDNVFTYEPKENERVVKLNEKISIEEVKQVWDKTNNLIDAVPDNFDLVKVVKLENDIYEYMLEFNGVYEGEFFDVFFTTKPFTDFYVKDAKHGILEDGWVEIQSNVVNVFKEYIGTSNVAKWVTPELEIVIVSSIDENSLEYVLEDLTGKEIKFVTSSEIEKLGVEPVGYKEGH